MSSADTFTQFLEYFFRLFAGKSFRGGDYLDYIQRPASARGGDEASIVDTAIVSPLLDLLGFAPAERVYNYQRQDERPDFAPRDSLYGTCFIVEDKSTSLKLDCDLANPQSHLSQLNGYTRSTGVHLGLLTNGVQLTAWRFVAGAQPEQLLTIDLPIAIRAWRHDGPSLFSVPDACDLTATISKNVFVPAKYPTSIVLRHNKLWLEVPDEKRRQYLLNYLQRPRWQGKTWDAIKSDVLLPEDDEALHTLFTLEQVRIERISTLLNDIQRLDSEIDNRVLDLYGITNPSDRARILGSAPIDEDDETLAREDASSDESAG